MSRRGSRSPEVFSINRHRARAISWSTVFVAVLTGCSSVGAQTPASPEKQGTSVIANMSPTTPARVDDSNGTDCIIRDGSGQQIWFGEANPRTTALGNALQAIVDKHSNQTAGVALCSHYEGAAIFVALPSDEVHLTIADVSSKFPDLKVITQTATASLSRLSAVTTKLIRVPEIRGLVAGAGPDVHSGGLLITVAQDKWPLTQHEKRRIDNVVLAIHGLRLPLTYEQGGTPVLD